MQPKMIKCYNRVEWRFNKLLHREDGPAIEWKNGYKAWYQNGERHRVGGPAVEWANGYKEWYSNGRLHRVDGPAVEYFNGLKSWYLKDKLYNTEEEWFKALDKDSQIAYLFNMEK